MLKPIYIEQPPKRTWSGRSVVFAYVPPACYSTYSTRYISIFFFGGGGISSRVIFHDPGQCPEQSSLPTDETPEPSPETCTAGAVEPSSRNDQDGARGIFYSLLIETSTCYSP